MAVEDPNKMTPGAEGGAGGEGGTPQAGGAATPQAGTPATPKPAAAKPGEAGASAEPKRFVLKGNEDEIPEDAAILEMTPKALSSKVARSTRKQLKELFGTDDQEQIKKILAEHKTLTDKAEADRVAQLTKEQQLEDARKKAESRALAAENRARQVEETRIFEKQDSRISRIAGKIIDEDHVEVELVKFAKHLTETFKPKELDKMSDKQLEKEATTFFNERVKTKPKIARDYEEKKREELKAELKGEKPKAKVTNGAGGDPPEGKEKPSGEQVVPGKLPPKEFKAWKRANGYNF